MRKRSGAVEATARWSYPLHRYDLTFGLRKYDTLREVQDFFIRRLGPATGFRFSDPLDFTTADTVSIPADYYNGSSYAFDDVEIGVGDGTTTTFQLVKKYTDAVVTRTRNIYKPVVGRVKSGVNGVEKTEGVDWTVDTTTGLLTYGVAPGNGLSVTAGFEFDVPVMFDESLDAGLFVQLKSFGGGELSNCLLYEIPLPGIVADDYPYGGSDDITFATSLTITPGRGRVLRLTPSVSGLAVFLPDTTELQDGAPYFVLINASGSHSFTVKTYAGATVFALAAGAAAEVALVTVSGTRTWYGF